MFTYIWRLFSYFLTLHKGGKAGFTAYGLEAIFVNWDRLGAGTAALPWGGFMPIWRLINEVKRCQSGDTGTTMRE